jgi:hypothetical protein
MAHHICAMMRTLLLVGAKLEVGFFRRQLIVASYVSQLKLEVDEHRLRTRQVPLR